MAWLVTVPPVAAQTVVFGGDRAYPPFHSLDERGRPEGLDVEVFTAVARTLGITPVWRLDAWPETLRRLEAGEVDVVPMFVSEERRRRFLFTDPFLQRHHLVFATAESKGIRTLADLAGSLVAVQRGGYAEAALSALGRRIRMLAVEDELAAVRAVGEGRADYALVPETIGRYAIDRHDLKGVIAVSPPLLPVEYAFAVTPSQPALVSELNLGLAAVRRSGELDRILERWRAELEHSHRVWLWLLGLALAVILPAAIVGGALAQRYRRRAIEYVARARKYIGLAREASRHRRVAQRRVLHLAFHDMMTGLPNRHAFVDALPEAMSKARANNAHLAVAAVDLLGLDAVRQIAGYGFASAVLEAIAARLRRAFDGAMVASLSSDTLAVLVNPLPGAEQARMVNQRISQVVSERVEIDAIPVEARCRIGLAVYPQHGRDSEELVRAADLALAAARARGEPAAIYDRRYEPDPRNLTLMGDLRRAIADNTLTWAFQPKYALPSREVVGAEMLVRWEHPRYGAVPPSLFVPLAEKTGSIQDLTAHLIRVAFEHVRALERTGRSLSIAINVSGNDLADGVLCDALLDTADRQGRRLHIEVTETAVMHDIDAVLANVERLRSAGMGISLDDFGTGYSSLAHLKRLAPEELKIDQSFVRGLLGSSSDRTIVRASIELAHEFGATVTAEGAEDIETVDWLAAHGCDCVQGYGLARPMPFVELLCDLGAGTMS